MHKGFLGSLVLVLALGVIFGFCVSFCFAEESLTISTYYPSPYGVYNELQSNKMAVGDTNGNGKLDAGDQPPADGQLYTARSVIYKPQSSLPESDARKGELVYSDSDNKFYYYDGSAWVAQGGGGASYTAWGTDACADGWKVAYTGWITTTVVARTSDYTAITAGDSFCLAGAQVPSATGVRWALFWDQGQTGGAREGVGGSARSCAVCVK